MNKKLIENFEILAKYNKQQKDEFRQKAYENAISYIRKLDYEITDVNQLKKTKGFGSSILGKIQEFFSTGKIAKVEEVRHLVEENSLILESIHGIGPVKAKALFDQGIKTVDDVRRNQDLLTDIQRIGLKYYEDFLKPLPKEFIYVMNIAMQYVLIMEFGSKSFKMVIAGSYRRGKKQSGDMDCLITSKKLTLHQIVNALIKWGVITDVLSIKNEKFMGVARCQDQGSFHFRMDIEFLSAEEWGAGLLYFTGSKEFNIEMRGRAKRMSYVLNEHGLFDNKGKRIQAFTEEDIMKQLGMIYIPPHER